MEEIIVMDKTLEQILQTLINLVQENEKLKARIHYFEDAQNSKPQKDPDAKV